jgi:peptidoglycan/xylan/chitin deacetylase (PgdA/CDA1 family)
MTPQRHKALLTVDLEDYRRQATRDDLGGDPAPNPTEVESQLDILLTAFEELSARATFFTVGRLTRELGASAWKRIVGHHELGCHGDEHERVWEQGERRFREDLRRAKDSLEQCAGVPVRSYRAPYFSSDGCDPWFGEVLGELGFRVDSSRRLGVPPKGFSGTLDLPGSGGRVKEVPLPSVGFGLKRLTVIGGTYFRLLPLEVCRLLLKRARAEGFIPMVYLHPYDVDATAAPLDYPAGVRHWAGRAGDSLRRFGRATAVAKLRALANEYAFEPLSTLST